MKILLTTDGSGYSEAAAKFLTGLALSKDDEIAVFHAISWVPIISEWELLYDNFKEIRDEVVPKILDATTAALKPVKAKISTSYKEDYPDKAILDAAEESGADLIVMGARGVRGIGSHIIGSVTKIVATKSRKPVLIIKHSGAERTANIKILFATDGSEYSDKLAVVLTQVPFPESAEITVLHLVETGFEDIPERFAVEIDNRVKTYVAEERAKEFKTSESIIEKARAHLRSRYSVIEELIKFGDPSEEIIKTAEAINADVIAVGSSGMRGIRGIIGSVSRHILNHAKCSVLIGKS